MKRVLDNICVIMFFTIIIMFAASTLFFRRGDEALSVESGDIPEAAEQLIEDNFPLQSSWRGLRTWLLLSAGKTEIDGSFLVDGGIIRPVSRISQGSTESFVKSINSFGEKYGDKSVFAMVIPSESGIYSADIPSLGSGFDQKGYIDSLYYSLDSSIVTLDAYGPLYTSRENYIFLRTDELLTANGAFSVYYSSVRKMGFSPKPLSDYDSEHALGGYIGSLCNELNIRARITPDNIELLTPKNGTVVSSAMCYDGLEMSEYRSAFDRTALLTESPLDVYMYGSRYECVDVKTINRDNPSILIVKTGGANPIIPFMISHYSRVTVIDTDTASSSYLSTYADPNNYDQICFMFDIESIEGNSLERLLT